MRNSNVKKRIVIVGGGFGGMYAAKKLKRADAEVVLIDKRNFHIFQPLLYQVATGGLSPADIASPLRGVLKRNKNVTVFMATVTEIDLERKLVKLEDRSVSFDYLILATGAENHYFGNTQWAQHAPGLKTIEDALLIRQKILYAFEAAEREPDPEKIKAWLTFIIVGGGPTGVELAGAIAEIAHHTIRGEFRKIRPETTRIILLEGSERVLPSFPSSLSTIAKRSLEKMKVEVLLNARAADIQTEHLTFVQDGTSSTIEARTILWAAGVKPSFLAAQLIARYQLLSDRSGRLIVEPQMNLKDYPDVFVIGDLAHYAHQTGEPLPGLSPVAMQEGSFVAGLLTKKLENKPFESSFHYFNKGNMATIGRNAAVGDFGKFRFGGFFAWLLWLFVHLMYQVEFDNRLLVLTQWAWNYFTKNRGARLISGEMLPSAKETASKDTVAKEPIQKDS